MNNAILIHGTCDKEEYFNDKYPSLSNSHWFPWLQKQLLIKNIFTQTPEIPDAYSPDYNKWKSIFEKFDINENSILVGHSCGGGFLLRWLTENKVKIHKLILIAPWLDPERKQTTDFFDFKIDSEIQNRVDDLHIFISFDDEKDILDSFKTINESLPDATFHKFNNKGHFTSEKMEKNEFPELLEII